MILDRQTTNHYYELVVSPSTHYDLFLDFLLQIYENGFEEQDGSFILRDNEPLDETQWALEYFNEELKKNLQVDIKLEINQKKLENIDWVDAFKKSVQPIYIAPFYIHQSWNEPKENAINLVLDPALAFGSGHHETTSSVIQILINIAQKDDIILDVGTGSGILSLVCSKIGSTIDFCDIDPLSIESAIYNFKKNNLTYRNFWIGSANTTNETYSLVIANIIPDVIIAISQHLNNRVKNGGKLLLSGILSGKDDSVIERFKNFKLIQKVEKGEWITLLLEKRDNI